MDGKSASVSVSRSQHDVTEHGRENYGHGNTASNRTGRD